jgi:hypothetical protein
MIMYVKHTKPTIIIIITPLAQSTKNVIIKTSSFTRVLSSNRRSSGSSSEGGADDLESRRWMEKVVSCMRLRRKKDASIQR